MGQSPVIVCLSESGAATARRIAAACGWPVHGRAGRVARADAHFADALEHVRGLFAARVPVVGVCASGVLIRAVAPLLADKRAEPPVVSVADDGSVVVPLLGGHRGANRLARQIAEALDGVAAVTTAGDVALGVALDEPPAGWVLENPDEARAAMAALLAGGGARITGEAAAQAGWLAGLPAGDAVEILCTMAPVEAVAAGRPRLVFRPQRAVLGVGCARGCPPDELAALAEEVLQAAGIAPGALAAVATVDIKADEPAVLALARRLGVPLRLFSPAELEAQTPRTANPSAVVHAEIGSHGVAENAALAAAGAQARLAVPKRKTGRATAALGLADAPIAAPAGRPRGRVSIIGIGPGRADWRTPEASALIARADELVGYSLYLDLLGPLAAGKPRADFPLGGEEARCRHALERAAEGREVALVCSGDAGIYAMASLVFELLDRPEGAGGVSDAARRVEVVCAPGVTAMQAAAARIGAPLGHDFCAISLSDLLTPCEDILRRLRAAAEGDFVVAFYNPVSKTRRTLLAEARDILLAHRPAGTPVVLARSLGRADEDVRVTTLGELRVADVDMLTVVLVGSSNSRRIERGDGVAVYTPRGYARKLENGRGDG